MNLLWLNANREPISLFPIKNMCFQELKAFKTMDLQ